MLDVYVYLCGGFEGRYVVDEDRSMQRSPQSIEVWTVVTLWIRSGFDLQVKDQPANDFQINKRPNPIPVGRYGSWLARAGQVKGENA